MKKLLLITFLLIITFSYAQEKDTRVVIKNNEPITTTLLSLSASPNPLTIRTRINFTSTKNQSVEFTVKNLVGKTVYLKKINAKKGLNSFQFNKNDLNNGMYIYSLQSDSEIISKRLIIR
ncbi:T9SS type A sorting domain-containing protein [Lutibacter sp. A80]|uniref:T9SS type A sorting domain-containing protein n=1 Tax=Lutibacter sp. A80 TaxID=2918453 RepID=UPI001F06C6B3|nr:T9SS type A sorting domain-containing protein [Lutibacter sp. A80]UMB60458.1 T9SS type A sorting domain-containing protein [Lutibacter sp. A80]